MHHHRSLLLRISAVLLFTMLGILATHTSPLACLNDSDRRRAERREPKQPEPKAEPAPEQPSESSRPYTPLVSSTKHINTVIAGGFARLPDAYYMERIKHGVYWIEKRKPEQRVGQVDELGYLGLYDDVAVASDKLGKSQRALEWMALKREEMDRLGYQSIEKSSENQRYTYYANIGTFRMHKWLKENKQSGANISRLERAISEIERALEIYPGAHSGRERTQLKTMKWIHSLYADGKVITSSTMDYPLPDMLGIVQRGRWSGEETAEQVALGLTGLIALGNAWESIDVFYALGLALQQVEDAPFGSAQFAFQRAHELAERSNQGSLAAPNLSRWELQAAMKRSWQTPYRSGEWTFQPDQNLIAGAGRWHGQLDIYVERKFRDNVSPIAGDAFWGDWKGNPFFYEHPLMIQHNVQGGDVRVVSEFTGPDVEYAPRYVPNNDARGLATLAVVLSILAFPGILVISVLAYRKESKRRDEQVRRMRKQRAMQQAAADSPFRVRAGSKPPQAADDSQPAQQQQAPQPRRHPGAGPDSTI